MSEIQWNLLNTNAPAQVAASFNPLGSYIEGAGAAQKLKMNELAMKKQEQDMQYNPYKIMAKQQEIDSRIAKNTAATQETKVKIGLKEQELAATLADRNLALPDEMLEAGVHESMEQTGTLLGKSPAEIEQGKKNFSQVIATQGIAGARKLLGETSMKLKDQIAAAQGQQKIDQGQQGLGIRQQNADNYGISVNKPQFLNTGGALVQNPGTGGGNVYEPIPITPSPNNLLKMQQIQEIGANRPHVANLMAKGWMPPQRVTKPMMDAIEAAATEAEKQGLPFDPDDLRAYEFQAQKNQATGRTAESRMVIARKENIDTADKLIGRMQETAKQLDFSDIKIAAIADKWVKGQMQDPVLSRYMTQRADALFALGNALKQNGLTDKAIQIEEEAAHPTVSPAAFDAWFKVQKEALSDARAEMEKDYNPPMPNKQGNKPAAQKIGRFQIEVE